MSNVLRDLSIVPFRCSPLGKDPGLTNKQVRPERLARDKHFSLFGPFVRYKENMFHNVEAKGPTL
jgi:hypothetical protein